MKKHILTIGLLSAIGLPAAAEGFYVTGDVGQAKFNFNAGGHSNSKTDTDFSLGGGYRVNDNLALEVSYRDFGNVNTQVQNSFLYGYRAELSATSINASLIASFPISDAMAFYGRVGVGKIKFDAKGYYLDGNGAEFYSYKESSNKLLGGVGLNFSITEALHARVEYNQYATLDDATERALTNISLKAVTFGVEYSF